VALGKSLWRHRQLIAQMTRREVMGRYKGSIMGLAWSFFNPVFMLVVYTFVFSVIFTSRWGVVGGESKAQFAVVLFVGMIVHGLFAEVLNRAPGLILSNVNYVKKVVFPLEILPVSAMGATLFHRLISLGVLLSTGALFNGYLHWTAIFTPLVLLPLVTLTLEAGLDAGSLGCISARRGTNHRHHYYGHDVSFPRLLSSDHPTGRISSLDHGQPAHLHH
jgi:lipopolysaccharide transport system permease protein